MQLVLKPQSHPQWGEVKITDRLFAIGRNEQPFDSYQGEAVARLSRRHARIFEEGGAIYIADLGSTNGTKLNGRSVRGKPVQMRSGDELCLADQLTYKIDIEGESGEKTVLATALPPIQLTLQPSDSSKGIEPIIISRFPFLVSKADEVFTRYKEHHANEVNYLSRRHALIFQKNDELYIEDLGSTNGTFLSENRLDEHAKLLQDGDSVAFGGNFFVYTAKLYKEQASKTEIHTKTSNAQAQAPQAQAPQAQAPQAVAADGSKTTFVSSATSFLDIFYLLDDDKDKQAAETKPEDKGKASGDKRASSGTGKPRSSGFFARTRTFLAEFGTAFSGSEEASGRRWVWWLLSIAVIAIAVGGGVYILGSKERQIKELMVEKKYLESAQLANQYLQSRPGDANLAQLATESLAKSLLLDWLSSLNKRDYAGAQSMLEEAKSITQSNKDGLEMLDALTWVGKLQQFVEERGGADAPIVIFEQEDDIAALLGWWNSDPGGHRRLFIDLLRYVPSFEDVHTLTFSHLRKLRNEQSLYLKAIEELKTKIEVGLRDEQAEQLAAIITEFENRYPKVQGLQKIKDDLERYLTLEEAIQKGELDEFLRLYQISSFQTPPFVDHVARRVEAVLPPEDVLQEYQKADEAWLAGSSDLALGILGDIRQGPWDEITSKKLTRYQEVDQGYQALKQARGAADYGQQILAFYMTLDDSKDTFYKQAIESDFLAYKEVMQNRAQEVIGLAEGHWLKYQEGGGIDSLERINGSVTRTYRQQGTLLSKAYAGLEEGIQVYKLLRLDCPRRWKQLQGQVIAEVERQRQWLVDLNLVLEPSLLRAKLELLPDPQEDGMHECE